MTSRRRLDPRSRIGLWETIEGLVAEGATVLLTTQYLDEADRLADSIAVIDHGQVIAQPVMFTLLFRYVFGGAIDTGGIPYVEYLIPGSSCRRSRSADSSPHSASTTISTRG